MTSDDFVEQSNSSNDEMNRSSRVASSSSSGKDAAGVYGHRERRPRDYQGDNADVDPIRLSKLIPVAELDPSRYGLKDSDRVPLRGLLNFADDDESTEIVDTLRSLYCGSMSAEFSYLETEEEREWFARTYEAVHREPIADETRRAVAREMLESQAFDRFLARNFPDVIRCSGEGAESTMAFFHELFELSSEPESSLRELVLCMPHRGRKLRGESEFPEDAGATGDIPFHTIGRTELGMLYNPSHLDSINAIVEVLHGSGQVRSGTCGIHVNADDPEMVLRAARIAIDYQRKFRKDVYVDLNCFRYRGHHELDDPTLTNPLMYKIINNRPSIPDR
ncbi:hypothetical protein TKK_0013100 [Trichogramma kaykai]